MKFFSAYSFFFLFVLFSCNSTNKSVVSSKEIIAKNTKMVENGFIKGTIVSSKNSTDCPIAIKVEGKEGVYFLDPINLKDDYKTDGEKVWFKFDGLRMMNRCDNASPISIIEIQKREN